MRLWPSRDVRMRTADAYDADFHLLEELARPPACANGGRISVWVYRQGPILREIVLSGHAETRTCSRATSILIEAAKRLDRSVEWMLTCGVAFFRASQPAPGQQAPLPPAQGLLGEAVEALRNLAEETGLVEVFDCDWQHLAAFRSRFKSLRSVREPLLVLPSMESPPLADCLPIVPDASSDAQPLVFRLEGWDFDCPDFQAVADLHLQNMRRELLRDALQRRQTYRSWLQEWMQRWVPELRWLPAGTPITLLVPPASAGPPAGLAPPLPVNVGTFLREHAASFLDRGQLWHQELAGVYAHMRFGLAPAAELDKKIRPNRITEIDFERGVRTVRDATLDDESFTLRQRITRNDPDLISHCLLYIRRMDEIIQPYEQLRASGAGCGVEHNPKRRDVQVVAEISRRIVLETMIRGWPSFYLEDERDRDVFDRWARVYRQRVWRILTRQAKQAGVAPDLLLEDNVVYDVRFDDDLGCTVQPLLLVDEATHAQVHGSRAGASTVVPLWSRRSARDMNAAILALGPSNERRAAELVSQARGLVSGSASEREEAVRCLRTALACHPAEGGRLILEEWARRLGRGTLEEFDKARWIVEGAELCARGRFGEAKTRLETYLGAEAEPVSEAFVLAALSELIGSWNPREEQKKLRDAAERQDSLVDRHNQVVQGLQQMDVSNLSFGSQAAFATVMRRSKVDELKGYRDEIEQARKSLEAASAKLDKEQERCRGRIEEALADPDAVAGKNPALVRAARQVPERLRQICEHPLFAGSSEELVRRYGRVRGVIEVRGLFEVYLALSRIDYRIGQNAEKARQEHRGELEAVRRNVWLPEPVEKDLENLAREFAKGAWDRLQTAQIHMVLGNAVTSCLARMIELMRDRLVTQAPFAEAQLTRIHVLQTLEGKYRMALEAMLGSRVILVRAGPRPWQVLDRELASLSADSRFRFDAASGEVVLESAEGCRPLLRMEGLSRRQAEHLREIVEDPDLPSRMDRFASSVAEALLGAEVDPGADWRAWRDAMAQVSRELLTAMSRFRYRANLMPEASPPLNEQGEAMSVRMNGLTPHTDPLIDWEWNDPGAWRDLLGAEPQRRRGIA